MRSLIGWTCVIALAIGCGKKKNEHAAAPAAGSGSAAGSAAGSGSAAASAATEYDTQMKAGQDLEDSKDWNEALAAFEAALKAKPGDVRALNEIAFTAYFADKLSRAQDAAIAAATGAKDDKKAHAQALFNLGLAVEKAQPYAAAQLYMASLADRPHRGVNARLVKLLQNKAATEQNKDALAILSHVNVTPTAGVGAAVGAPPTSTATGEDQALMAALEKAGVEWESGAGKSVLLVQNLECKENHQSKKTSYECTAPAVKGDAAKALIAALGGKKIDPVKDHGDVSTWRLASVRCRSFNEGDSGQPDVCEVTP